MTRKAIIIGSPLTEGQDGYLNGVRWDMYNYRKFLMSCEGGGWYDSEIITFTNPDWHSLNINLASIKQNVDICYVIFSGHGLYDYHRQTTMLQLNDHQNIPYTLLDTQAKRQVRLIDSCRPIVIKYPDSFFDGGINGIGDVNEHMQANQLLYFRKIYNQIVSEAPKGKIDIFSAKKGQYSSDISNQGGWFTSLFIKKAIELANNNILKDSYFSFKEVLLPVQAHMEIYRQKVRQSNGVITDNEQVPEGFYYDNNEELFNLPFSLHYKNTLYPNQNPYLDSFYLR